MNEPTLNRGRSAARHVLRVQPDAELSGPVLVGRTIAKVERDLILCTVEHCRGNRTHAATILGISVRTLRNKLRKYATDVPRRQPPL
jgi:two-component system, response regulator FlrC